MQAIAYLGKADELLRWSSELRGLQLPQLPTSLLHPWQSDKTSQPAKGDSAEPQPYHGEGSHAVGDDQCSNDFSSPHDSTGKSGVSSRSDNSTASAKAAKDESSSSAPPHQSVTDVSHGSDMDSTPSSDCSRRVAQNAQHTSPDSHAQHLWSSWLRWQDRLSIITSGS